MIESKLLLCLLVIPLICFINQSKGNLEVTPVDDHLSTPPHNDKVNINCNCNCNCNCNPEGFTTREVIRTIPVRQVATQSPPFRIENCADVKRINRTAVSGIYEVQPKTLESSIQVYCDMDSLNGGWTVFQRRMEIPNNKEYFYRKWKDYKEGFGNLSQEFWIGNDNLHALTRGNVNVLRVELEDFEGNKKYAQYNEFAVGSEADKYKLTAQGYTGDAGDAMSYHNSKPFTTIDVDNDQHADSCSRICKGAWWYDKCHNSNLNALYLGGKHASYADGVGWIPWKGEYYSLKFAEMKFRPKGFPLS